MTTSQISVPKTRSRGQISRSKVSISRSEVPIIGIEAISATSKGSISSFGGPNGVPEPRICLLAPVNGLKWGQNGVKWPDLGSRWSKSGEVFLSQARFSWAEVLEMGQNGPFWAYPETRFLAKIPHFHVVSMDLGSQNPTIWGPKLGRSGQLTNLIDLIKLIVFNRF